IMPLIVGTITKCKRPVIIRNKELFLFVCVLHLLAATDYRIIAHSSWLIQFQLSWS
ncbi:hypothetical protein Droror1_Dr00017216, partial [Drosera rotundifolia]